MKRYQAILARLFAGQMRPEDRSETGILKWNGYILNWLIGFTFILALSWSNLSLAADRFAVIGDLPYSQREENVLRELYLAIAERGTSFILHTGDIKAGREPCSNELLIRRIRLLHDSPVPLVYTPGDNEWTDCARDQQRLRWDPLERLAFLRHAAFMEYGEGASKSLGQKTMPVVSQGIPYVENLRWTWQSVTFATVHVVGSFNHSRPTSLEEAHQRDYPERQAAALRWLDDAFSHAKLHKHRGLVLVMQGNPFEGGYRERSPNGERTLASDDGYTALRQALIQHCQAFQKPVLLVHGDTHRYRYDQPLMDGQGKRIQNFFRVENFGSPFVANWVEIELDRSSDRLFIVRDHRLRNLDTP